MINSVELPDGSKIKIDKKHIPDEYINHLLSGKVGGLVLVFLNADNQNKLKRKFKKLVQYCKELNKEE